MSYPQNNLGVPRFASSPYGDPYVVILEQPAPLRHRFRYECEIEGRTAGAILGVHTTSDIKTYPKIKIMNYQGPFWVYVSCVTKDGPRHRPHPHRLLGQNCQNGVFSAEVKSQDMTFTFTSLGIECVKRRNIESSLNDRRNLDIDPFRTGFNNLDGINLNILRLCFQVFIPSANHSWAALRPVVSEPIYDKKAAMSHLTIMKLSHYSAPATGGTEVILLCDRVSKDNIQIWFYEEQNSRIVWEIQAEFRPTDVHKQVAIVFRTPRYRDENIRRSVEVCIQLRNKGEGQERGEPRPFQFSPRIKDPDYFAPKRSKTIDFRKFFQVPVNTEASLIPAAAITVPRMLGLQNTEMRDNFADSFSFRQTTAPVAGLPESNSTLYREPVASPSTSQQQDPVLPPVLMPSPEAQGESPVIFPSPIDQLLLPPEFHISDMDDTEACPSLNNLSPSLMDGVNSPTFDAELLSSLNITQGEFFEDAAEFLDNFK